MSTIHEQLDDILSSISIDANSTLKEIDCKMSEIIDIFLQDEDPLHRLVALKQLSAISSKALANQDIKDVENRFAENIKQQIERQNTIIKQKNKEYDDLMKSFEERLSGIRQHAGLVKKIAEHLDNIKNDKSINDEFSNIETAMASIEEQLKTAVAKRNELPVGTLNY